MAAPQHRPFHGVGGPKKNYLFFVKLGVTLGRLAFFKFQIEQKESPQCWGGGAGLPLTSGEEFAARLPPTLSTLLLLLLNLNYMKRPYIALFTCGHKTLCYYYYRGGGGRGWGGVEALKSASSVILHDGLRRAAP